MPRRKAEKVLRVMAELMASEAAVSALLPIRPATEHAAVQQARREAVAVFQRTLPVFLAMLDRV